MLVLFLPRSPAGAPVIKDGNRVAMFNLSMLSEPKESQMLLQLAVKVPTLEYFGCVRYIYLTSDCMSSPGEQQLIAAHTMLEEEKESEWVQVTIVCENCNWEHLQQANFVLQLRDDNNTAVPFTDETAAELKCFLILYTSKPHFPYENFREEILRKRQAENDPEIPVPVSETDSLIQNRTTLAELLENNVICSNHEVYLTQGEIHFDGDIVAPLPGIIKLTYCLGECSLLPKLPSDNETSSDPRTEIMIHNLQLLQQRLHPPPCCVTDKLLPTELIIGRDGVVYLETFPSVTKCKCQL